MFLKYSWYKWVITSVNALFQELWFHTEGNFQQSRNRGKHSWEI